MTVPKTVKTVGSGSFASDRLREVYDLSGKCSGLSISVYNDLEAPSTLRDTGDGFVFESGKLVDYYGSDKTVALPNSLDGNAYSIAKYAFSNSCAEVLVAADTVMCIAIESYAFSGSGLTAITVPKSVENIYENAFVDCCSLCSVAFSDGTSYSVTDMDFAEIFIPSGPSENAVYIKQNIGKKFTKIA